MKLNYYLLVISLFSPALCQAAYDDMDQLFTMKLEQLMSLEVTTVSKRSENLGEAPGVVTVISAEEIRSFGARNLKDILLRIPHLYIFDSSTFTASGATLRAGATQHLNNHLLYLINGRPVRESQNGGLHTDINLIFPIEAIERLEVIRGPGSVLYGSNAFSGTVNIITKTNPEDSKNAFQIANGSHAYRTGQMSMAGELGNDGGIEAHILRYKENGDEISPFDEGGLNSGPLELARDGTSLFVSGHLKGFSINSFVSNITTPIFSGAFLWQNLAEFELKRDYIDLGYEHSFNNDWVLSTHYTYNKQTRFVNGPGARSSEFMANGYTYEASLNGKVSDKLDILVGGVVDQLRGDLGTRGGQYTSRRDGIYGQFDYHFTPALKLTAGLQWNKPEGISSNTSPRFALIYRINPNWSSKFLYSEAFRSPYGSELFFDARFLQGDQELKPEKIDTVEAQAIYNKNKLALTATVYRSKETDAIGRDFINGTNTFVNKDEEVTSMGLEIETRYNIHSHWHIQGNYSFQTNEDNESNKNIMPASRSMAKIGLAYRSDKDLSIGIWNSYFGAASKSEDIPGNSTSIINPPSESYHLLSINLNTNLGKISGNSNWENLELSLFANNLLDEEVWFPETGRRRVNTYPQSHSRSLVGSIRFSF